MNDTFSLKSYHTQHNNNRLYLYKTQDLNSPMRKSTTVIIIDHLQSLPLNKPNNVIDHLQSLPLNKSNNSKDKQPLSLASTQQRHDKDDDIYNCNAEEHKPSSSHSQNKQHNYFQPGNPISKPQQTLWSQLIVSPESQYTYDSTASCTIMALECALQEQLEHKNYLLPASMTDQEKISQTLRIASMYKSDIHTDVDDVMANITRYKENLRREKSNQILVPEWNKLSQFIINTGKEWKSEISAVVTKPPETIFVHFHFPLLPESFDMIQPMIFDSHARTEREFYGAHILRFEDIDSFEKYLKILWPKVYMGENPTILENQVNIANIDIITLNPTLRKKPLISVTQLKDEFQAMAKKIQPWKYQEGYNAYNNDSVDKNEYNNAELKMESLDTANYDKIIEEKDKTITGLQNAVKHLNEYSKAKVIKFNAKEQEIKTLQNDKQQLIQDKDSLSAKYNALAAQITGVKDRENVSTELDNVQKELMDTKTRMTDMEYALNIEKNQWKANELIEMETREAQFESMMFAKDEEIKRIEAGKDKVIEILNDHIKELLSELLPYREEKKRLEYLNRKYECPICFVEYKVQDDAFLMDCDHLINRECALQTFKADIMHNKILPRCPQCLAEKVSTIITPKQLECVMDPKTLQFYYQLSLNVALQQANLFHCPTVDCPFFAEIPDNLERFNCNKCGYSYCVKCKHGYHHNETCEEYKKRKYKEELLNEQQLAKLAKEKGWKQCPKCHTYIERTFGCFHMKCGNAQCKTEFCDNCGKQLGKNWRVHFNPPSECKLWKSVDDLMDDQKEDSNSCPMRYIRCRYSWSIPKPSNYLCRWCTMHNYM